MRAPSWQQQMSARRVETPKKDGEQRGEAMGGGGEPNTPKQSGQRLRTVVQTLPASRNDVQ